MVSLDHLKNTLHSKIVAVWYILNFAIYLEKRIKTDMTKDDLFVLPDGGLKGSDYRDEIYLWDAENDKFLTDDSWKTTLDTSQHAAGLISPKYVRKMCWKYL